MHNDNNDAATVYVVQADNTKDLSPAREFGKLRAVFTNPRKPYNTDSMINKARLALADWQPGDYLLMVGDPALCAVCMTVIADKVDVLRTLSWDRVRLEYRAQSWNFDPDAEHYEDPASFPG